tara:strand:+ start:829 stop:1053 length:225 start_codon:yes stop_codon:yes gene_type:complete
MLILYTKNTTILPKECEFDYYDSILSPNRVYLYFNQYSHYLINIEDKNNYGCFYSLKDKVDYKPFITCHGIIKK